MYDVGGVMLCLTCFTRWQQANAANQRAENERLNQLMAHQNYLSEMMAWIAGVPDTSPKFRIPQPILANISQGQTLNYINIDRSVIGMLNTGSIEDVQRIDVNVKSLVDSGNTEFAKILKSMTEAIASNGELSDPGRSDLLEQLNLISGQAALPEQQRKIGLIKPVLSGLASSLSAVGSLAKLWQLFGDSICTYFGVDNPLKS